MMGSRQLLVGKSKEINSRNQVLLHFLSVVFPPATQVCVQGVLEKFRLLWIQQTLLLDTLPVFYLEKYSANHSFLPENPLKDPAPAQTHHFNAVYYFFPSV